MIRKGLRKTYSTEEDKMIVESVNGAKERGLDIGAVYATLSEDLKRTEPAIRKRYLEIKRAAKMADKQLEQKLHTDIEEPLQTVMFNKVKEPEKTSVDRKNAEETFNMLEHFLESKKLEQKAPPIDILTNKLEQAITEKIEIRIERNFYKKKYEELQEKFDKIKNLLED